MSAMSEASFLLDISRWSVQGHIDFVNEVNSSLEQLQQHNQQVIKSHDENDKAGAQRVQNTLPGANSVSA